MFTFFTPLLGFMKSTWTVRRQLLFGSVLKRNVELMITGQVCAEDCKVMAVSAKTNTGKNFLMVRFFFSYGLLRVFTVLIGCFPVSTPQKYHAVFVNASLIHVFIQSFFTMDHFIIYDFLQTELVMMELAGEKKPLTPERKFSAEYKLLVILRINAPK
jgi:hypothetical protein